MSDDPVFRHDIERVDAEIALFRRDSHCHKPWDGYRRLDDFSLVHVRFEVDSLVMTTIEVTSGADPDAVLDVVGVSSLSSTGACSMTFRSLGTGSDDAYMPSAPIDLAWFSDPPLATRRVQLGCFSRLVPLVLTFEPRKLEPIDLVLVCDRYESPDIVKSRQDDGELVDGGALASW